MACGDMLGWKFNASNSLNVGRLVPGWPEKLICRGFMEPAGLFRLLWLDRLAPDLADDLGGIATMTGPIVSWLGFIDLFVSIELELVLA